MINKKILVCDDDPSILEMVGFVLELSGYTVITEENSMHLYKLIEKHRPDLLLVDLWMPLLSGDLIIKNLKADPELRDLPAIAISASRDGQYIAEEAGADGFIAKPFDIDHLLTAIEQQLARQLN